MLQRSRTLVPAAIVTLLGSLMMAPVPAQDPQVDQEGAQPLAGFFRYKGGPVKGKYAVTQTNLTQFPETPNWVPLPGAVIPNVVVPAGGNPVGDLFNVAFSAECFVNNGAPDDYLRIRILDNGVPMEPYDGFQAFCSAQGLATHKGNWVKRANPGNHTLTVQFWVLDVGNNEVVSAIIDDWTFELVVYD